MTETVFFNNYNCIIDSLLRNSSPIRRHARCENKVLGTAEALCCRSHIWSQVRLPAMEAATFLLVNLTYTSYTREVTGEDYALSRMRLSLLEL